MFHIIRTLDCDATEVFRNAASLPDWSSCIAFKNRNDECGKGPKPPVEIYLDMLNKTENVSSSKEDKFECIVNCGEGFQQRKLINSDNCTAIQFRSCWVGTCSSTCWPFHNLPSRFYQKYCSLLSIFLFDRGWNCNLRFQYYAS